MKDAVVVLGCLLAAAIGLLIPAYGDTLIYLIPALLFVFLAAVAWKRRQQQPVEAVAINPLLVALPTTLAVSSINVGVGIAAAAVLGLIAATTKASDHRLTFTPAAAVILAVGVIIMCRPNYPLSIYAVVFFMLACLVTVRAVILSESKASALVSLVDGVGVFLMASIALRIAGISGVQERTQSLANSITGGERIIFPLSGSLAMTPVMAAIYIVGAVPLLIATKDRRPFRLIMLACGIVIFILTDSRSPVITTAVLVVAMLAAPRLFRRAAPWLVGFTLIVPFIYSSIQDSVAALTGGVSWLSRRGEASADTLNGRERIWDQALHFYTTWVDWWHQMVGYGAFGHAKSGATKYYYQGFEGFGDKTIVTPHNATLQLLFDGGWLSVAVFGVAIVMMARAFRKPALLPGLAMTTALAVASITEVATSPSHAHAQPTWWILLALSVIAFSKQSQQPQAAVDKRAVPARRAIAGPASPTFQTRRYRRAYQR